MGAMDTFQERSDSFCASILHADSAESSAGWDFLKAAIEAYEVIGADGFIRLLDETATDDLVVYRQEHGILELAFRGTMSHSQWFSDGGNLVLEKIGLDWAGPDSGKVAKGFAEAYAGLRLHLK